MFNYFAMDIYIYISFTRLKLYYLSVHEVGEIFD